MQRPPIYDLPKSQLASVRSFSGRSTNCRYFRKSETNTWSTIIIFQGIACNWSPIMSSEFSPVFLRTRLIVLSCLTFGGILWAIFLSIVLFSQWELLDIPERSLVLAMLVTHTFTSCMLLILLIVKFRPWLDGARVLLLLLAHIGAAAASVYWYPTFTCVKQDEGICQLIIAFILIASWIVPILLIIYGFGLSLMVWRRRGSTQNVAKDEEKATNRRFAMPEIKERAPERKSFTHRISNLDHLSAINHRPMTLERQLFPDYVSSLDQFSEGSANSRYSQSTKKSSMLVGNEVIVLGATLSKPPPVFHL